MKRKLYLLILFIFVSMLTIACSGEQATYSVKIYQD
jgi:hypothetical protein